MLPSETMIWQPEFTDKTLSRKPGAVQTVPRDASGEKRIKGEKDGRMLMNVGLNAEIRDNLRFGLEFEKSAFGKYNVDNAVNASFRYSF
ncbi:TPA: autotransporter outer membrane beta-barrel domain-containing protein [Escherichia coli]